MNLDRLLIIAVGGTWIVGRVAAWVQRRRCERVHTCRKTPSN